MRFRRKLEMRVGIRLCVLSVVLMAIVGSFLLAVARGVGSAVAVRAAVKQHMHGADQAGIAAEVPKLSSLM
jgi:ABC-type phosphate transport system permease subunit